MYDLRVKNQKEAALQEINENSNVKILFLRKIFNLFTLCKNILKVLSICNEEEECYKKSVIKEQLTEIIHSNIFDDSYIDDLIHWKENFRLALNTNNNFDRSFILDIQEKLIEFTKKIIEKSRYYHEILPFFLSNRCQRERIQNEIDFYYKRLIIEEKKYSLRNLRYLMVINKNSGIKIFDKALKPIKFDTHLISGFLTAIQCFGMKLSFMDTHINELIYNNIRIHVETGNFIRVALILDRKPSNYLIDMTRVFINKFENDFHEHFLSWKGNVGVFRPASEIVNEVFNPYN